MNLPADTADTVDLPCPAYEAMDETLTLIHDLRGTVSMRAAGTKWLPQEPKEDTDDYNNRLGRTILYEAFNDTSDKISAMPFSKPVALEKAPDGWDTNVDRKGTSLHSFSHSLYKDGVKYGVWHLLVDYPVRPASLSIAEKEKRHIRGYFVRICPRNLFWWWIEADDTGMMVLKKIKFREPTVIWDPKNKRLVEGYDIVSYADDYIARWSMSINDQGNKVFSKGEDTPNKLGKVPLITKVFGEAVSGLSAHPPLNALAWMNLRHWQSFSDQANCVRFARISMIFMSGVTDEEKEKQTVIAANRVVKSTNSEAKAYHVEHSGAAIAAGERDLVRIEERMQVLGLQPLVENTGNTTAQGRKLDEAKSQSKAQEWVNITAEGIKEGYALRATWDNITLDPEFKVKIFCDFVASVQGGIDSQTIYLSAKDDLISVELMLREQIRRGTIAADTDIQAELDKSQKQRESKRKLTDGKTNPQTQVA